MYKKMVEHLHIPGHMVTSFTAHQSIKWTFLDSYTDGCFVVIIPLKETWTNYSTKVVFLAGSH